MFKKLINHDKSKSKNESSSSHSHNNINSKTVTPHNNTTSNGTAQLRKVEKETTQHIEDAGKDAEQQQVPVIEEDPADLVPFSDDPNLPFGDGANKIFGMENFGNTCYCNSILQVLYYTTNFRRAILTFPERDPDHFRKRRLNVPGTKAHAFVQAALNQERNVQAIPELPEDDVKGEKKKSSIFSMGKSSKANGISKDPLLSSSSNATAATSAPTNGSSSGNVSTELNGTAGAAQTNTHLIDKNIANKYPALKSIKPTYQLNQQRTLSILGDTEDPTANVERRKRFALMQGPIINLDLAYNDTYSMQTNLFTTLKDIFECMVENKSQTGVVSPQKLIEVLKQENELFRSSMHQDAHEFLNFLINSVLEVVDTFDMGGRHVAEERKDSSTSSLDMEKKSIHEIFEGVLTSETKCLCCERTSTRDEKFLDLSIDLTPSSSVTSCLKQFSQSEMLQEQNKFYCDSCHSLQEAAKSMRLKKLPKILALHLKRFKYSEELNRNMKLFHRVTYPKNLRLFNTTADTETPDKLYQLYAVVVHIGGGPHHGHYVSLIKTENFGWLLFDDEAVESIDENYVFKFFGDGPGLATAYVLFYKETDELSNMNNNLFNGYDDDDTQNNTTLDLNFNQVSGSFNEKLTISTPIESISDSKKSDENATTSSDSKPEPSSASSAFESVPEEPHVLQSQLRNASNGSAEKRKSKMFGWKKT